MFFEITIHRIRIAVAQQLFKNCKHELQVSNLPHWLAVQFAQHRLVTSLGLSAWLIVGCNFIGLFLFLLVPYASIILFFFVKYASIIILVLLVGGDVLVLGTQEFGYVKVGVNVQDLPLSWLAQKHKFCLQSSTGKTCVGCL